MCDLMRGWQARNKESLGARITAAHVDAEQLVAEPADDDHFKPTHHLLTHVVDLFL